MQSLFIIRKCLIESEEDDFMMCVTLGAYGCGGAKSWWYANCRVHNAGYGLNAMEQNL